MKKRFKKKSILYLHYFFHNLIKFKKSINYFYIQYFQNIGQFLYVFTGFVSALILILEFGFYYPSEWSSTVAKIGNVIINFFLFYEITSFLFTKSNYLEYFRTHIVEFTIILLVIMQDIFKDSIIALLDPEKAGLLFLSITQVFFLFSNISHLIRNTKFYDIKKISPSLLFVGSFALIIIMGAIVLHFPKASNQSIPTIDILFTAVSATCVTGLSTLNIAEAFSFTGQVILILLMQAGGLGIMTLASFFGIFLTGKTSVNDKLLMKDLLSEQSLGEVKYLLLKIAIFSFVIEGFGTIFMYFSIPDSIAIHWMDKLFIAIFHSVSSFCNAGFSLLPNGFANQEILKSKLFLSSSMILITFGGIGFPVLSQTYKIIINPNNPRVRYSVSAKLVLITSLILFILCFVFFFILEKNKSLKDLSLYDKIFHSLFYSVTLRTAGFNTFDISLIGESMVFFSLFFMWVGASPTSTGGGIKTSTFSIALLNIWFNIRGKKNVEFSKRTISRSSISRASATILLSFFVIFISLFLLTFSEKSNFLDLAFEVVSAYGTVGLSRGITEKLTFFGKIVIMSVMFIGRIGVFNLILAMVQDVEPANYQYPEEEVVVS